jgi:hypothetical protein
MNQTLTKSAGPVMVRDIPQERYFTPPTPTLMGGLAIFVLLVRGRVIAKDAQW